MTKFNPEKVPKKEPMLPDIAVMRSITEEARRIWKEEDRMATNMINSSIQRAMEKFGYHPDRDQELRRVIGESFAEESAKMVAATLSERKRHFPGERIGRDGRTYRAQNAYQPERDDY
ncbi:hypothetical protein EPN83_02290 [Patescibacteria group bacterium]|nr:MAG: hypothetical protein EPN83_02290 [Patescibacteria group bacterium]